MCSSEINMACRINHALEITSSASLVQVFCLQPAVKELGIFNCLRFMNKAYWDRLPPAAKAALDKYSGKTLSRRTGNAIAEFDSSAQERFRKETGQNYDSADPEEKARWQKQLQGINDAWVKTTPNGAAVLAAFRSALKKVAAGQ